MSSLILCVSLNSKNSLCIACVLHLYCVLQVFCAVKQLAVGDRIPEHKCYVQYLIQVIQLSSHQSWVVRLYSSGHEFSVTPEQLRIWRFGLLFIKNNVEHVWQNSRWKMKRKVIVTVIHILRLNLVLVPFSSSYLLVYRYLGRRH